MLAQNFLPAAYLGLTDRQRDALVKVLAAFERGEVPDAPRRAFFEEVEEGVPTYFCMPFVVGVGECGTTACILGWANHLENESVFSLWADMPDELERLFGVHRMLEDGAYSATVSQAATALRNYLTTGKPRWREAKKRKPYNANDDFTRSLEDCYSAVRDRVEAGGEGWGPK